MDKRFRVLVAEDESLVAELIEGLLTELEHTVVGRASDGRQAVKLVCELRPNAVLMDIHMPDMDGLEAARIIARDCPTPVVILTAYETPDMLERASAAGVGAYLTKPPRAREMDRALTIAAARFDDMMQLRRTNAELREALRTVKALSGMLPICSSCKKIRDDKGHWRQVEEYISDHVEVEFSHSICPDCAHKFSA